jgi:hypothetical protein
MGWQIVYIPFLFAGDTIINQNGVFIYNGTPALGNLKVSIAGTSGVDQFGNPYIDNVVAYNIAVAGGGYAQIAANPVTGVPFLVLYPPGGTHISAPPQINSNVANPGAANEQAQLVVSSGDETAQGNAGAGYLQVVSRSNDGSIPSFAILSADEAHAMLLDTNVYSIGHYTFRTPNTIPINSTSPIGIVGNNNVIAQAYRIHFLIVYVGGGVAASATIAQNGGTATISNTLGIIRRVRQSVSADVVNPVNQASAVGGLGLAYNAGELCAYEFDGVITFSTAGTFLVTGQQGVAGATWNVGINSFCDLINIQ